jgi:hypothetical protein
MIAANAASRVMDCVITVRPRRDVPARYPQMRLAPRGILIARCAPIKQKIVNCPFVVG